MVARKINTAIACSIGIAAFTGFVGGVAVGPMVMDDTSVGSAVYQRMAAGTVPFARVLAGPIEIVAP